jgi:phage gp45-like
MSDIQTAHAQRGTVMRAVVRSTDDGQGSQLATVTVARHVDRSDVEVLQPFGMASRPPKGGMMVVLAVGGDQGDLVGLPAANPSVRMGGLGEGETVIYNAKGDRVLIKADGAIEITTTGSVVLKAREATVTVTEDRVVGRIGSSRFAARPGYAKLVSGAHHLVVSPDGITVSQPPVVGPDPEPAI